MLSEGLNHLPKPQWVLRFNTEMLRVQRVLRPGINVL